MKNNFKNYAFLATTMLLANSAHAYKFVIYTDEAVTNKSQEVAELMKNTYPFNKFNVEVEIVRVPSEELDCDSTNGIDRLVTCKGTDGIQAKTMRRGGDQAMIIKNMPKWGGSSAVGGGVPVITTGTDSRAMLHEYMHTLGLCDEYEYKASEAETYCKDEKSNPNLTFITPRPSYGGDAEARSIHSSQIPWYGDILPSTMITSASALGTGQVNFGKKAPINTTTMGMVLDEQTGLYQGKVCNQARPPRASWHPGSASTVMNDVGAGLGAPLEKIVERIMASKGARKKMNIDDSRDTSYSDDEKIGGDIVTPEPKGEVNNTPRNLFKSFFDWIKELFESFGRSLTR